MHVEFQNERQTLPRVCTPCRLPDMYASTAIKIRTASLCHVKEGSKAKRVTGW